MSAWAFGWEALVAILTGTLAVATVTLALATRRLARETAAGQWRPIIVMESLSEITDEPVEPGYFMVSYRLRNVGPGPALHLFGSEERFDQWITMDPGRELWNRETSGVLASGAETTIMGTLNERSQHLRFDYRDVLGSLYVSEFELDRSRLVSFKIREGVSLRKIARPAMGDVLALPGNPLRPRIAAAALTMWPPQGTVADPLAVRTREAVRALRGPRTQTFSQRVRWFFFGYRHTYSSFRYRVRAGIRYFRRAA